MFIFKWYMLLIALPCGWQLCQVGCEWVCLHSARIYTILKASTGQWWRQWLTHACGARSILPNRFWKDSYNSILSSSTSWHRTILKWSNAQKCILKINLNIQVFELHDICIGECFSKHSHRISRQCKNTVNGIIAALLMTVWVRSQQLCLRCAITLINAPRYHSVSRIKWWGMWWLMSQDICCPQNVLNHDAKGSSHHGTGIGSIARQCWSWLARQCNIVLRNTDLPH